MIKSYKSITYNKGDISGYAFDEKGIQIDSIMTVDQNSNDLLNCLTYRSNQFVIASCGAIDQNRRKNQFIAWAKFWQTPRLSLVQPSNPAIDWEVIEKERNLLEELNLLYLNLHKEEVPLHKPQEAKLFNHLSQIQNMEAWSVYCSWMNDEMERVLRSFLPTMIDEYQLEAKFKDFRHEVQSVMLRETKKELLETKLLLRDCNQIEEVKVLQKKLLLCQEHLFTCMQQHEKALEQVEIGIGKIEKNHPELIGLKRKITLLKTCLHHELSRESQTPIFLLHQLLNLWFQVTTVISGRDGLKEILLEFAARQALVQTAQGFQASDLLDLLLNWKERVAELLQFSQAKGAEAFYFWLHVPSRDSEDAKKRLRVLPLYTFQTHFIDSLTAFAIPLVKLNEGGNGVFKEFPEMLAFTPFIRGQTEQWVEGHSLTEPAKAFYSSVFS